MNLVKSVFTIALFLFLSSCKKETKSNEILVKSTDIKKQVDNWLDEQISLYNRPSSSIIKTSNSASNSIIENFKISNILTLKKYLNYEKFEIFEHNASNSFLIIPINEGIKNDKKLEKNSSLNLMMTLNPKKEIISANIVYYLPNNKNVKEEISPIIIKNIFNHGKIKNSGLFKFLSITGKWLYQMEFRNEKMFSFGIIESRKNSTPNNLQTNSICIDWYLVTTITFSNGTISQTEEYVGTTCPDACSDPNYASICPDGGGGNGGVEETIIESSSTGTSEEILDDDYNSQIPENSINGPNPYFSYFMPIKYTYIHEKHVKTINNSIVVVTTVDMEPVMVDPYQSEFIDKNGDAGVRKLTKVAEFRKWYRLVSPTVLIQWKTDINGLYVYRSLASESRQWPVNHQEID